MRDDERPSIRAMWEENVSGALSRTAARRGQAPFQDAHFEDDVQPIFESLIATGIDDVSSPEYALAFYPRAHELALHAENALLHHGDRAAAAGLYLRACALLRLGRHSSSSPAGPSSPSAGADAGETTESPPHCPIRARAWHLQKSYHTKAGRLNPDSPTDEVLIPHTHDAATKPDESTAGVRDRGSIAAATKTKAGQPARPQIPAVVRLPQRTLRTGTPCPAVLVVTGDRTAHTALCGDLVARGWGCVVVEAPGCGDCPVSVPVVTSDASALWASVLDWMAAIRVFDMARVVVWAAAAGGSSRGAPVVGQFAAAVAGSRVRGCVAVVSGDGEAATMAAGGGGDGWGSTNGRVLVVADNHGDGKGAAGAEAALRSADGGIWAPAAAAAGAYDARDDGLVLFEYGAVGGGVAERAAVRTLAAGAAAVYDWVEDLLSLDLDV